MNDKLADDLLEGWRTVDTRQQLGPKGAGTLSFAIQSWLKRGCPRNTKIVDGEVVSCNEVWVTGKGWMEVRDE